MLKGNLIKFIARCMRLTLVISLEGGEEVEVSLNDDLITAMYSSHERVSYTYVDVFKKIVPIEDEEITCIVEDGQVVDEIAIPSTSIGDSSLCKKGDIVNESFS